MRAFPTAFLLVVASACSRVVVEDSPRSPHDANEIVFAPFRVDETAPNGDVPVVTVTSGGSALAKTLGADLQSHSAPIVRCFADARARGATVGGVATLRAHVLRTGEVDAVTVDGDTLDPPAVASCAARALGDIHFHAFAGDVTLVVPLDAGR